MLIFVIFVTTLRVTKFSAHKIFHSRNFHSVIAHVLHNVENKNMLKAATATRMAQCRYLHPIEKAGIDPSLSRSVPPFVLTKVSKKVKKAEARLKRGTYLTVAAEEKVRVATYGSIKSVLRGQTSYDVIWVSGFGSHEI